MESCHATDVQSKDFILLLLLAGLTSIDQLSDIFDRLSGPYSKGSFDVIERLELGDRRGRALGGDQLFSLRQVAEKLVGLLAFVNSPCVFENEARGLLGHDRVDSLKGREGCNIAPLVRNARRQKETSTTASLSHFVQSNVAHLCRKRLDAGRKMVQQVQILEVALLKLDHRIFVQLVNCLARQENSQAIAQILA